MTTCNIPIPTTVPPAGMLTIFVVCILQTQLVLGNRSALIDEEVNVVMHASSFYMHLCTGRG